MDLLGKKVQHKKFGVGEIVEINDGIISVAQEYYFQGIFSLVNYAYEDDKDEEGNIRKEYKFRLRKIKED